MPAADGPPPRLVPATPLAIFPREHAAVWCAAPSDRPLPAAASLGADAAGVLNVLADRGASFFNELRSATGLDADRLRQAIGTLVAAGLIASDGFSGVRALIWATRGVPAIRDRRTHFAGRWSM